MWFDRVLAGLPGTRRSRRAGLLALLVIGLSALLAIDGQVAGPAYGSAAQASIPSVPITPATSAVVTVRDLAEQEAGERARAAASSQQTVAPSQSPGAGAPSAGGVQANAASPSPATSFRAQDDEQPPGGGFSPVRPDTSGAVGLDKVMVTTNSFYRVQDKATGAELAKVTAPGFWAPTGASGVFRSTVLYDPYNSRWLISAVSDEDSASSSLLIAISQGADPEGAFTLFRIDVDSNDQVFAETYGIGFNKTWVSISPEIYRISDNAFLYSAVFALDYAQLRAGTLSGVVFGKDGSVPDGGVRPAVTYSTTLAPHYLVAQRSGTNAQYTMYVLTGTASAPALGNIGLKTHPLGGFDSTSLNILPQQCLSGCPNPIPRINNAGGLIANVVFRNNALYYVQTVALNVFTTNVHTAVQWTQIDQAGDVIQTGRIEDPSATPNNGGKWYAYPSIGVNAENSVMVGFSQFASNQYASAGYAVRLASEPFGTMHDPIVYKAGEDFFEKVTAAQPSRIQWGLTSSTQVDPSDDRAIWTIQEFANPRVVPNSLVTGDSRWGTWWARVALVQRVLNVSRAGSGSGAISGDCTGTGTCVVTMDGTRNVTATFAQVGNVGVQVQRQPGVPPPGGPVLISTLTARPGCGTIDHIEFGEPGTPLDNASVTITAPVGGPANQIAGFNYTPPPGNVSVTLAIQRVEQAGSATVNPIRFFDQCSGAWRTFVGGGPNAFK